MTNTLEGFPAELVSIDLGRAAVSMTIDSGIYPLEALYGAAYVFIDRCYVVLDRPEPTRFRVTLSTKSTGADEGALRALVGEFANELLSCAWRHQITQENRSLIEAVTTQAFAGAMGPPSLDELAAFDFTEESFEDPLGIAMSWEDKYKKKDKADATESSKGSEDEGSKSAEATAAGSDEPAVAQEGKNS
jgi:His-Xaa-Ser system protein HxsD